MKHTDGNTFEPEQPPTIEESADDLAAMVAGLREMVSGWPDQVLHSYVGDKADEIQAVVTGLRARASVSA